MLALAVPTSDSAGQPAGLALNCASVHAFCSVVKREGSCLGRSTLTDLMFASPPPACGPPFEVTFTSRLAPWALLALPCVEAENVGLNGRFLQPAVANGLDTATIAPVPWRIPVELQ